MSIVRSHFAAAGGFRTGLGRIGTTPFGCEETEAEIRVRASAPWGKIVHLDGARADHVVPRSRATWSYSSHRCLAERRSKAIVTDADGRADGLSSERRYVLRTPPFGVLCGVGDICRGDVPGLLRSGAIVAGRALTALGYPSVRQGVGKSPQDGASQPVRAARMGSLRVRWCIPIALVDWTGTGVSGRRRGVVGRRRKIGVK
jgi:O-antigen biosynthesis protein